MVCLLGSDRQGTDFLQSLLKIPQGHRPDNPPRRRQGQAKIREATADIFFRPRQNLLLQSKVIGIRGSRHADELLQTVGLAQERRKIMKQYSTGMKQRYGLASALLGSPELLLLDEPMNGLDPSGVAEIRELLLRLHREKGLTILISSHLLGELHKVATDYIFLRFGQVLETVTAAELDRRIEERKLKDAEAYFIELERAAQAREGGLLGQREG